MSSFANRIWWISQILTSYRTVSPIFISSWKVLYQNYIKRQRVLHFSKRHCWCDTKIYNGKKVLGFQHLFSLWDSTLPCGSWYPMSQITATKQMLNIKWPRLSHHKSKNDLRVIENIIVSILTNPNFYWGNSYYLY